MRSSNLRINVFNRQRKHGLDATALREFLYSLASRMSVQSGFSVMLVSDAAMSRYNRQYAAREGATDVLSFPETQEWSMEAPYAGDIVISVETAQRQSEGSLLTEVKGLAVHGLLHLLGYDHETDNGEMLGMERRLREEFELQP